MAKVQQTASELSRTLAGQLSKTEKRLIASRSIAEYKQSAAAKIKAFKQNRRLNK
jgi:hypothetical protein